MPHFDPSRSTTRDVVRNAIILESHKPMVYGHRITTAYGTCAFSVYLTGGEKVSARTMVTHHWANLFCHTCAAIVAHALELPTYGHIATQLSSAAGIVQLKTKLQRAGKMESTYWLCACSVDQHASICGGFAPGRPPETDSVTGHVYPLCDCGCEKHFAGDLCEMNKFDDMMVLLCAHVEGFEQVVAVDKDFDIFFRAWCVAELVEAANLHMAQCLKVHSNTSIQKNKAKIQDLDVRNCKASREEDEELILSKIPDIDGFNKKLRELLMDEEDGLLIALSKELQEASVFTQICALLSSVAKGLA
eukprot:gnl/TRDRNA2_/TRDRNA2_60387_c0_seq1.p1 gnl/TRDRNA2_/TRDRNA2_60387_c0~~gnl/TRDRNA2_/TRDRNA2_60387_c0_seq1.p1  ORF type:complete len:304 (-),score=45.08 gnl/TRDRNA2_/TRDRNA2_60387_c0_seq1:144-1055(-)